MKKISLIAILMLFVSVSGTAKDKKEPRAPFNFHWGMKINELDPAIPSHDPLNLHQLLDHKNLTEVTLFYPKPAMPDPAKCRLAFDGDYGLQRVRVEVEKFKDSDHGFLGRFRYKYYKKILTKIYGKPTLAKETINQVRYVEPFHFYKCLRFDTCGAYASFFEKDGVQIMLRLYPADNGGQIVIEYEGPQWQKAKDNYNAGELTEDAL